jgi:hypothetical protein
MILRRRLTLCIAFGQVPMLTTEVEVVLHCRSAPLPGEQSYSWTLRESSRPAGGGLKPTGRKCASTRSSLVGGGRNIGAISGLFLLKGEQVQEVPSGLDRSHDEKQWGETSGGKTEQPAV